MPLEFTKIGSYLQAGYTNSGTIIAQGTQTDSILFTNIPSGSWWGSSLGGIIVGRSATLSTTFQYCEISNATTGTYVETGATIQYCWIHDNRQYGINFSASGLDLNVSNNTYGNNPLGDTYQ